MERGDSFISLLGCGVWLLVFSLAAAGFLALAAAMGSCVAG
ncbi:MAG TPA: hypothetical protein VNO22_12995 [Planctomycetota bacterium]|nr:hypothetical protein [Planctomycetota bacterium]